MDYNKEFILCAAIHFDDGIIYLKQPENVKRGFVLTGFRHPNIIQNYKDLLDETHTFKVLTNGIEGFLTSKNNFVNREDAFWIAKNQNQIRNYTSDDDEVAQLISEDLY